MSAVLNGFLSISPAEASRLAPATIRPFAGWTTEEVRKYLAAAVRTSEMVSQRLNLLHALKDRQEAWWNAADSPEQYWFGDFSVGKVNKLWWTFQVITRKLSSRRLDVICNAGKNLWGMAIPVLDNIVLGKVWLNAGSGTYGDAERVVTLVHEAAHLAGRFTLAEGKKVGRNAAHGLTLWPMRATRNAENYGYYALEVLNKPRLVAA